MTGWNGKGSDRRWRKYRARVLRRDQYICQLQIKGICTKHANSVHHPTQWEGHPADYPIERALSTCGECNRHEGKPQAQPDPEPKPWPTT